MNPNEIDWDRTCRIYDADHERFAIVDEKYFSQLVTMRDTHPGRTGKLLPRRWLIKPTHPTRNGKKLYFVSNAGWRDRSGNGEFLHVAVMRLTGRRPPSDQHTMVDHEDGDEWNCVEGNLRWVTPSQNRRNAKRRAQRALGDAA